MKLFCLLGTSLVLALLSGAVCDAAARSETRDDALGVKSDDGTFQSTLSGTLDLELYTFDEHMPGLLYSDSDVFLSPRLCLFLDAYAGRYLYGMVQARVDRGFDPGYAPDGEIRLDEYFLRLSPWEQDGLSMQAGKFATVCGNWTPRHDSWRNPFINAPLPYENMTIMSDLGIPAGPAAFLGRRDDPDDQYRERWLPVIWGPAYASGGALFWKAGEIECAFEAKNAALSSRTEEWDPSRGNWESPTLGGRVGWHPNGAWDGGASFSHGPYLREESEAALPAGTGREDFQQTVAGLDLAYARRQWELWAELIGSRFEVPNVGDADTAAYYVETRYGLPARLYAALRWNQQFFADIPDGQSGETPWDQDMWRTDVALGGRYGRHLQGKLQYSFSHQEGPFQQGEQLLAAQVTVSF